MIRSLSRSLYSFPNFQFSIGIEKKIIEQSPSQVWILERVPSWNLKIEDLDPFALNNLDDAIQDLMLDNKRNMLIWDSLMKTICYVVCILGAKGIVKGKEIGTKKPTKKNYDKPIG